MPAWARSRGAFSSADGPPRPADEQCSSAVNYMRLVVSGRQARQAGRSFRRASGRWFQPPRSDYARAWAAGLPHSLAARSAAKQATTKALSEAEAGWRAAVRQISDRGNLGKARHDGVAQRAVASADAV
jgi:hypothetical protein